MTVIAYRAVKRAMDLVLATAGLLATSPLNIAVGIAIKLDDGGPILYRGTRVGVGGTPFNMLKFRSMVIDADRLGGPSTPDGDSRLTRPGRFIRRWKLDELPQLLNVVRGEMSLVGPRPQVPEEVARYDDNERQLLTVLPGITDWASIRFRDEGSILAGQDDPDHAYDQLIRPEKSRLGLLYVREASVATDLRILRETARALLGREPRLPKAGPSPVAPSSPVSEVL